MKLMSVEKAASNKNSVMYCTWRCFVFGSRLPPVYSAVIKCGFSPIGANGSKPCGINLPQPFRCLLHPLQSGLLVESDRLRQILLYPISLFQHACGFVHAKGIPGSGTLICPEECLCRILLHRVSLRISITQHQHRSHCPCVCSQGIPCQLLSVLLHHVLIRLFPGRIRAVQQ